MSDRQEYVPRTPSTKLRVADIPSIPTDMVRDGEFSELALEAYEETMRQLYVQSLVEVERIRRSNALLQRLEEDILNPVHLENLDLGSKMALAESLSKNNQVSTKSLIEFGKILQNVRSTVGSFEGLQRSKQNLREKGSLKLAVVDRNVFKRA